MGGRRWLILSTYGMAVSLIVVPLFDAFLTVRPLQPMDMLWRFGAVGTISGTLVTPLLGLAALCAAAFAFRHRRALRAVSVLSLLGASLAVAALPLFVLDTMGLRNLMSGGGLVPFYRASASGLLHMGSAACIGLAFGAGGWIASRGGRRPRDAGIVLTAEDTARRSRPASGDRSSQRTPLGKKGS